MAYFIEKTDTTPLTTITDGTVDNTTTLTLFGKSYSGFGKELNENLVKLLENSANSSAPSAPLRGELWFDTSTDKLKVYDGTKFKNTGGTNVQATQPTSPSAGDFWQDSTNNQLYFYTGSAWLLVGPQYTSGQALSGWKIETVTESGTGKVISSMYVGNIRVAVLSKETFTPDAGSPSGTPLITNGFAEIKAGLTLNSTLGAVFEGTNTQARYIDVTASETNQSATLIAGKNFLRADATDTTTGALTIDNDSGITVGDAQELTVSVSSNNVTIAQTSQDKDIIFKVNDGGVTTDVLTMIGSSGGVRIHGDLTIDGTQTVINTTTISVEDNIIELNRNVSSASAMPNYSGLKVRRSDRATPTEENLYWVWDETFSDAGYGDAGGAWTAFRDQGEIASPTLVDIRANIVHATSTSAQYADLAEIYNSDHPYEPGTVVIFGGPKEITISQWAQDTRVAGVVSTNPAYLMNDKSEGVAVALVGKVPCKVEGMIEKGDLLTTSGKTAGYAKKAIEPKLGSIIGKAMESHQSAGTGTIFVSVGKL